MAEGIPLQRGMVASLWIMRHASAGPTTDAKDDDKRPLDEEGELQSKAAGIALKRLKTPIQNCLTSPLTRAQQTAEIVCRYLDIPLHIEPALFGGPLDPRDITKHLGNCLLVGHSPSVSLMVYRLTGAQVQIAKGGLAQIHEGEVWSLLNPSTCMVMAGMKDMFDDPQEVDHRSADPTLADQKKARRASPDRPIWMI